jgi:taurine dioxygenase
MSLTCEAPLPGAAFGATLRLAGTAREIVAAAERDSAALPAALAEARGLLLLPGMGAITDDPGLLIRLSRTFGPEVEDYRHTLTDLKSVHVAVPEILLVSNMPPVSKAPPKRPEPPIAADGLIPVQYPHRKGWHTDQSYRRPPPDISLFYAVTPATRDAGQTLFANGILAYEALPPALKTRVDGLTNAHSANRSCARIRWPANARCISANGARWTGSRGRSSAWSPDRTAPARRCSTRSWRT